MSAPATEPVPSGVRVPERWQAALVVVLTAAAAIFVLGTIFDALARVLDLVSPLVIAFAIAYVLDPVIDRFEARGLPRKLAIAVVILLGLVLATLFVLLLIPPIAGQLRELGPRIRELGDGAAALLGRVLDWLRSLGRWCDVDEGCGTSSDDSPRATPRWRMSMLHPYKAAFALASGPVVACLRGARHRNKQETLG